MVSLPLSGAGKPKTIVHNLPNGNSIIGLAASGNYLYLGVVVTSKSIGKVFLIQV